MDLFCRCAEVSMDVHLKNLFTRYQEQFGCGPGLGPGSGTCLLKVDGITPPFIKSLYRAAAALYRTDPWKRLRPEHLFGIKVGKDSDWSNRKQPFPCVQFIGGDGGDIGIYMFRAHDDAKKMTASRETIRVPNTELLRVTYEMESIMFPSNKRMIKSLGLEVSGTDRFPVIDVVCCMSSGELQFRNPTLEELKFAYAVMRAISLVHPLLRQGYDAGPKWSRMMFFESFIETVDVQWPLEMARGNDLVAVTVSHPSGNRYEEKNSSTASSTPTKFSEPSKEETLVDMDPVGSFRLCMMCEEEISGEQSICCGRCGAIVYCSSVCQHQHWNVAHKDTCALYKSMMEREEELAMTIFTFNCCAEQLCKWLESLGVHQKGMWKRKCNCFSHCFYGLLSVEGDLRDSWGDLDDDQYPHDSPIDDYTRDGLSSVILLSGWSEYYNLRSLPLSSPVADILSHPLTVYYTLTTLSISSKNLLLRGKEVIVHYLGPESELDWMPAFAEIGHLLNGLGSIQMFMIGPEVPTNLCGTTSGVSNRVRINFVRGIYQEEVAALPSPQVILALNCELETNSSWVGALDLIFVRGLPAFFSCQSEISSSNAKQVLHSGGLHISYPMTPNPFRSPVRNYGPSTNFPSYSNGFMLGVNT